MLDDTRGRFTRMHAGSFVLTLGVLSEGQSGWMSFKVISEVAMIPFFHCGVSTSPDSRDLDTRLITIYWAVPEHFNSVGSLPTSTTASTPFLLSTEPNNLDILCNGRNEVSWTIFYGIPLMGDGTSNENFNLGYNFILEQEFRQYNANWSTRTMSASISGFFCYCTSWVGC